MTGEGFTDNRGMRLGIRQPPPAQNGDIECFEVVGRYESDRGRGVFITIVQLEPQSPGITPDGARIEGKTRGERGRQHPRLRGHAREQIPGDLRPLSRLSRPVQSHGSGDAILAHESRIDAMKIYNAA